MANKPTGYFEKILAFDCETSGLAIGRLDPTREANGDEYQMVSAGLIIADFHTLKPIEKLYIEIKWNGTSKWAPEAERVHGLSKAHLEENGVTEEEAVLLTGDLLQRHLGNTCVRLLGHNVATFDRYFLSNLFTKFDIPVSFGNRHIDTFSLGSVLLEAYNSDQLFTQVGYDTRTTHNALQDAEMALGAARRLKTVFDAGVS